jgi:hypothetical protein
VGGADAGVYAEGYAEYLRMREVNAIFFLKDVKLEASPMQYP